MSQSFAKNENTYKDEYECYFAISGVPASVRMNSQLLLVGQGYYSTMCTMCELQMPFIFGLTMLLRLCITLLAAFILHGGFTVVIGKVLSSALLCSLHVHKYLMNEVICLICQIGKHGKRFH